ncbi:class I SAM-dependent methyltransferase [Candidatus Thorarchaeota archaeon]|nr:MAG: class I SAM-dependent methyltransferase [Candidatus Thorarchaeota archaeon]
MDEPHLRALRCPECGKKLNLNGFFVVGEEMIDGQITCEKGHPWSVTDGIPSLVFPAITKEDGKWIAEYDEIAESYDELVKQYNEWLGIDLTKERESLSIFIPIEGPCRILDVSIGTAENFVALQNRFKNQMGRFNLHGLDLSTGMLERAKNKTREQGIHISLTHGSVFNLPYQSNFFDLVLHVGGINTFSDIHGALAEMLRVVRSDGIVVVIDEGLSPKMRETERGKEIIKANSLFGSRPPLQFLPAKARNVEISYVMNDTFYQMVFTK